MAILDLFSKRQRRLRGDGRDVYQYTSIPAPLRVQVIQIIRDALGSSGPYCDEVNKTWQSIHDSLAREYGMFRLGEGSTHEEAACRFFLNEANHEHVLDFIELGFQTVDRLGRDAWYVSRARTVVSADVAIDEMNQRLREHAIGYAYLNGEIIRIDSQLVHAEVVKPALDFLTAKYLRGANAEYLRAHEHYRHKRFEECLGDCLKAYESTMKAICHDRRWSYSQTDTAKRLIEIIFANRLIPDYLQSEFTSLRTSLESGVPTVRNKQSGHGRGIEERSVPRHLAAYLLHLTAANILLLAEANAALR
jgi:hypothetical protein